MKYVDLTIGKYEIKVRSLTFRESLSFSLRKSIDTFFVFLKKFLEVTTTLDARQLNDISIQDAISIIVFYRMTFWENEEFADGYRPKDFIIQDPSYEEKFVNIDGYRFSSVITLQKAISAEVLCLSKGDNNIMNMYILASSCQKKVRDGVRVLLDDAEDTKEHIDNIRHLNYIISSVSHSKVDLLTSLENVSIINSKNEALELDQEFFFWA